LTAWTLLSKRVSRIDEDIKLFIASLAGVVWMYGSIVYYLTPDYLLSGRYFYAASALEYLLIVVCACTLIRAYSPDGVSARVVQALTVVGGIAVNIFIFFSGDGIATAVAAIIKAIMNDENKIIPVCTANPW
jgi:hypothetical protein